MSVTQFNYSVYSVPMCFTWNFSKKFTSCHLNLSFCFGIPRSSVYFISIQLCSSKFLQCLPFWIVYYPTPINLLIWQFVVTYTFSICAKHQYISNQHRCNCKNVFNCFVIYNCFATRSLRCKNERFSFNYWNSNTKQLKWFIKLKKKLRTPS